MIKIILTFILLFNCAALYAQQPPAQLPSLFGDEEKYLPRLRANETPEDIIRKNIFVKVTSGKSTVYTGEPLLVTYKFYTALSSQAKVSKQPVFTGCSVLELMAEKDAYDELVDGKKFHVFTMRKVQVTPLQEGTLELGKAFVETIVQLINADGTGVQNYSASISNNPISVQVKALPEADKPANFSGLIGNFSIAANVDSNKVPVGENAVIHITVKGTGNIAGIRTPTINWPAGTEHFDGSDTQRIDVEKFPAGVSAVFDIPFIGTTEGEVTIPPISFSYFDGGLQNYKTVNSMPLTLMFTKAVTRDEQMQDIVTEDITNTKYLWIVGAIGLTFFSVWRFSAFLKQKKADKEKLILAKEMAAKPKIIIAEKPAYDISEIIAGLNNLGSFTGEKDFLLKTKLFLTKALQLRLQTDINSENDLVSLLKKNSGHADLAPSCEYIFTCCNRNLYSPETDENIHEKLYFELTGVIKKLYGFA